MTAGLEMGENLGELVAHHRAEHDMGQASFAQIDEVAETDVEQVGQFLFSQPPCSRGICMWVHAHDRRVNSVRAGTARGATRMRYQPACFTLTQSADAIRARAYLNYQERGSEDGNHTDDWLRAEAELTAEQPLVRASKHP